MMLYQNNMLSARYPMAERSKSSPKSSNPFELSARSAKARALLSVIDATCIELGERAPAGDLGVRIVAGLDWRVVADQADVKAPSPETIALVVETVRARHVFTAAEYETLDAVRRGGRPAWHEQPYVALAEAGWLAVIGSGGGGRVWTLTRACRVALGLVAS